MFVLVNDSLSDLDFVFARVFVCVCELESVCVVVFVCEMFDDNDVAKECPMLFARETLCCWLNDN